MARTRGYKRVENNIFRAITLFCKGVLQFLWGIVVGVFAFGSKKLTIMIVPHSQKKAVNFQTSIFSLIFGCVLFVGVIASSFWFSYQTVQSAHRLALLKESAQKTQANLDVLRSETETLLKTAKTFQHALSATIASLGLNSSSVLPELEAEVTDLSALFKTTELGHVAVSEVPELRRMTNYLKEAIQPVQEMGNLLNAQTALFSDIPSLWPIKGGIGHISMGFGQNKHPFTGQWYVHKGIDLSTYRSGDAIIATADGQVVTVEYDSSWGNYIIIKHKHGFYTRYAHLQSYSVTRGQHVQQGQVIGYIGATGIVTGPHLHYEVHIGSDVVDPLKYLNIKGTRARK